MGSPAGIDLIPQGVKLWGVPLPRWLLPQVVASERADDQGHHRFDVLISLAPFGRLVHYQGWLLPA